MKDPDLASCFLKVVEKCKDEEPLSSNLPPDGHVPKNGLSCPDQLVGKLAFEEGFQFLTEKFTVNKKLQPKIRQHITVDRKPSSENAFILILESPHLDEYGKDGTPIGPANGATGNNIFRHLHSRSLSLVEPIKKCLDQQKGPKDFDLILVNAIQFQTSLGLPFDNHGEIRNQIFSNCWYANGDPSSQDETKFKKNFSERIAQVIGQYSHHGGITVVANCCTMTGVMKKVKNSIWPLVKNCIEKNNFSQNILLDAPRTPPLAAWDGRRGF